MERSASSTTRRPLATPKPTKKSSTSAVTTTALSNHARKCRGCRLCTKPTWRREAQKDQQRSQSKRRRESEKRTAGNDMGQSRPWQDSPLSITALHGMVSRFREKMVRGLQPHVRMHQDRRSRHLVWPATRVKESGKLSVVWRRQGKVPRGWQRRRHQRQGSGTTAITQGQCQAPFCQRWAPHESTSRVCTGMRRSLSRFAQTPATIIARIRVVHRILLLPRASPPPRGRLTLQAAARAGGRKASPQEQTRLRGFSSTFDLAHNSSPPRRRHLHLLCLHRYDCNPSFVHTGERSSVTWHRHPACTH